MNAVYATGWYTMTHDEVLASMGQYTELYVDGFRLHWDASDRRYIVIRP